MEGERKNREEREMEEGVGGVVKVKSVACPGGSNKQVEA